MENHHLIWQDLDWPTLRYDAALVGAEVARARRVQGVVEGKLTALGDVQRTILVAEAWSQEAVATAAIEGERLDLLAVRSSVARRLGVGLANSPKVPRHIDGLLDITDDAVSRAADPLSHERLQGWQAALFPTGPLPTCGSKPSIRLKMEMDELAVPSSTLFLRGTAVRQVA